MLHAQIFNNVRFLEVVQRRDTISLSAKPKNDPAPDADAVARVLSWRLEIGMRKTAAPGTDNFPVLYTSIVSATGELNDLNVSVVVRISSLHTCFYHFTTTQPPCLLNGGMDGPITVLPWCHHIRFER